MTKLLQELGWETLQTRIKYKRITHSLSEALATSAWTRHENHWFKLLATVFVSNQVYTLSSVPIFVYFKYVLL